MQSGVSTQRPSAETSGPPTAREIIAVWRLKDEWGFHQSLSGDELDAYADRLIASVDGLAPGFTSSILHRQVIGPYDMERTYGLIGGNIFHGELSAGQLFHMRPAPGWADFRTPIHGLYQAGSATHGGGGVTGIPGLNVVQAIREDDRLRRHQAVDIGPDRGRDVVGDVVIALALLTAQYRVEALGVEVDEVGLVTVRLERLENGVTESAVVACFDGVCVKDHDPHLQIPIRSSSSR